MNTESITLTCGCRVDETGEVTACARHACSPVVAFVELELIEEKTQEAA